MRIRNGGGPGAGSPARDPLGNRLEFSLRKSGSSASLVFYYCLGEYVAENICEKKLEPGPLAHSQGGRAARMASDVALQGPEDRTTDRVPVLPASGQVGSVCVRVCGQKRKRCTCTSTGGRRKTTEVLEEEIYKDSSREKDSLCIHHLSQPISYLGSILDVIIQKKKIVGRSLSTKSFYDLVLKPSNFPFWSSRITKILSHRKGKRKKQCASPCTRFLVLSFFPHAPPGISSPRLSPRTARSRGPLAGEHEQQEQGQVPQAAEEQLPGALPVRVRVEPEAEVGNVQVDGEGDDGEGPRGDLEDGRRRRQSDQGQAVAQGDAPAQGRVRDRHHAVAAAGVVFAEAPAQGVEMGELPRVEDPSQEKGSCMQVAGEKGVSRERLWSERHRSILSGPAELPPHSRGSQIPCQSLFSPLLVRVSLAPETSLQDPPAFAPPPPSPGH